MINLLNKAKECYTKLFKKCLTPNKKVKKSVKPKKTTKKS